MVDRIVRAIRLDWTVFREIAEDRNAMKEAAIIVIIVSFLAAIGTTAAPMFAGTVADMPVLRFFSNWIIGGVLIGWIGWAVLTYFVGSVLFKVESDIPEMMRVLGYASAPHLLGLLGFIPCVGWIFPLIGWLLALVAGVLAVREAMETETGNAIITVVLSWLLALAIRALLLVIIG